MADVGSPTRTLEDSTKRVEYVYGGRANYAHVQYEPMQLNQRVAELSKSTP